MKNIQALHRTAMTGKNISGVDFGLATRSIRRRFTIAEVNAGIVLVPKKNGIKYRFVDGGVIAIGGAAAAHTTIDILGTRAAGSVKLLTAAVANTTQSNFVKPGATGAVILADGASYTDLDANTDITVGKTGASITTATNIDFVLTYTEVLE